MGAGVSISQELKVYKNGQLQLRCDYCKQIIASGPRLLPCYHVICGPWYLNGDCGAQNEAHESNKCPVGNCAAEIFPRKPNLDTAELMDLLHRKIVLQNEGQFDPGKGK